MSKKRWIGLVMSLIVLIIAACGNGETEEIAGIEEQESDRGYVTLVINPKITLEYNEEGEVTDLFGMNEDGVKVAENHTQYHGKPVEEILGYLVNTIYEMDYFVDEESDQPREITLELQPDSVIPREDFVDDMTKSVEDAVGELDFDDDINKADILSIEEIKKIALDDAGVAEEDAVFEDKEHTIDINKDTKEEDVIFVINFEANGNDYSYNINGISGEIVEAKVNNQLKEDAEVSEGDQAGNNNSANASSSNADHPNSGNTNNSSNSGNQGTSAPAAAPRQQAPRTQAPRTSAPSTYAPAPRYYDDDDWDDDDDDDWDDDDDDDDWDDDDD